MGADEALELIGTLVVAQTGRPLDNLQRSVVRGLWLNPRLKYLEMAEDNGYSEAHVKDVAYQLWQTLSAVLGKKVSKSNFQSLVEEYGRSQPSPTALTLSPQEPDSSQQAPVDLDFVGREGAIADLDELVRLNKKLILILGGAGFGKTTLARKYLYQKYDRIIEFVLAKERKDVASVEGLVEEKLKQLGEEPGREFSVSLERLKQRLEAERIGVLIDNLEPALEGNGCFVSERRPYVELLRMLSTDTIQSVTLITSRDQLYEPAIKVETYNLKGLDIDAWKQFFENAQLNPQIVMHLHTLNDMHRHYGGNAKAMDLLKSAVQQDADGNLEQYWEVSKEDLLRNPGLENLVVEQFKRLQEVIPQSYNLLCRLGCYRYQDVPTVPLQGLLCLLWDTPERKMRVIDALKSRSLIEFRDDKYWLHPMIREEAIMRLRLNAEAWKTANRKAAEFWTDSIEIIITPNDARKALEAYYHYLEINEPDEAGIVLKKERKDKWRTDDCLASTLYTLGFLELNISLAEKIINRISSSIILSGLYNTLGDSYWLTGQLHKAIDAHRKSGKVASKILRETRYSTIQSQNKFIKYKLVSLFNIGLCKIDLWEIEEAASLFKEVLIEAKEEFLEIYTKEAHFCLAFLESFLGNFDQTTYHVKEAYYLIDENTVRTQSNLSKWGLGYCYLFLGISYKNLRNIEKAFALFKGAISFAEATHYPQVKAKALIGLSELYREQKNFEKTFAYHFESIQLLEKIGAKCDLAEAYFQLGLTYRMRGELEQSKECIERAIKLYEDIKAPKQIERVRQTIENTKA